MPILYDPRYPAPPFSAGERHRFQPGLTGAYETLIDKLSLPVCNEHVNKPLRLFFQPLVRPWKGGAWYLAEDFAFSHRARQCGIAVVADTRIRLWHVGDFAYSWEDAGIGRQRYGDFDFRLE